MRLSLFLSIIVIAATRGLATGVDNSPSEEGHPLPEESQNDRRSFPRGYAEPERLAKSAGISWATGWYVEATCTRVCTRQSALTCAH